MERILRFDSLIKSKSYDEIEKMMSDLKLDSVFAKKNINIHISNDDIEIGGDNDIKIGHKDNENSDDSFIDGRDSLINSIASSAERELERMSENLDNLIPILVRP